PRQRHVRRHLLRPDRLSRRPRAGRRHLARRHGAPRPSGGVHRRPAGTARDVRHLLVFRMCALGGALSTGVSELTMTNAIRKTRLLVPAVAVAAVLGAAADVLAQACAMCGSALSDDPLGRAISWSIIFLMAAPYT